MVTRAAMAVVLACVLASAGCNEWVDKYNPAEPATGARRYPPPLPPPPPKLTPASEPRVFIQLDALSTTGDHVIVTNQSDGAIYDLEIVVNHDFSYTMPVLQMGETVRVPDSYLRGELGKPFPTDRHIRVERVEARHKGRVLAAVDRQRA